MDRLCSATIDSPLGTLTLLASDAGLRAVRWPGEDERRGGRPAPAALESPDQRWIRTATEQLSAWFQGERTGFDVPLDLRGTPFQLEVWCALAAVGWGATASYADLSNAIGRPRATRAVGAAVGRNPVAPVLGCHRILGSDGSLTGFAGGLDAKRWLLARENSLRPGS
ncbi:MAG: methylated-DNA--[protein]-cysteine S-methyltransferase [Acidimicrobiales bacterium]